MDPAREKKNSATTNKLYELDLISSDLIGCNVVTAQCLPHMVPLKRYTTSNSLSSSQKL